MYRQIRGCGYAYGYDIYVSRDTGLIYFGLYRATHPVKAYKAAVDIVVSFHCYYCFHYFYFCFYLVHSRMKEFP